MVRDSDNKNTSKNDLKNWKPPIHVTSQQVRLARSFDNQTPMEKKRRKFLYMDGRPNVMSSKMAVSLKLNHDVNDHVDSNVISKSEATIDN